MVKKTKRRPKALNLYANLTSRRKTQRDVKARRRADYLATLPKQPLKRLLYRLHPKRVVKFWFSKQGLMTFLKLVGVAFIILAIFIAALFAYYRRELDRIRPEQIAKYVQTTVNKYYDRNGVLLWEDKGDRNYKLVIDSKDIPKVMKDATVAIEDKEFYSHAGISITSLFRAGINNLFGGEVQGASTLTQQLVKQVFFSEDAAQNRLSISRKIKEIILAIEVERMYNKDQILTLYLNEVPYGGRRNGVESAAQTYFRKPAKDLTLPEAALVASIPQNPSKYNPYTLNSNTTKELLERQHKVLDSMVELKYATKEAAEAAKKYPILDTIKPEISDIENIKAPHFVLEVRKKLEAELNTSVVRAGGLTIKTTLDYRVQQVAEDSVSRNYHYAQAIGGNNMAVTAIDVPTGQVLAMVGSHDYHDKSIGGEVNAATALLNPGSSIKPFIYANLFKPKEGVNFGAGTILADENIDSIYHGNLDNFDGRFMGSITIREALGRSRNPPAVKAAYIGGLDAAIQTAKDAGDRSYCVGVDYGLSAAIGSCAVREVEHVNSYATLARQGVYKPEAYVLEVKNSQGQVIQQWKDNKAKNVIDPQITYILSDILNDGRARSAIFGSHPIGFNVPGVKTATKTGTTNLGNKPKDAWMMSYTPRMAVGVWTGRNDPKAMNSLSSTGNAHVIMDIQQFAHEQIFAKDGSWKADDWFTRPAGIQTLTVNGRTDIFPSWYTKPANSEGTKIVFDLVSKKKATDCTPPRAKIELTVQSYQDPATKRVTTNSPDGYNADATDDVHKCSDLPPFVAVSQTHVGSNYTIKATVSQGTFALSSVTITVDGQAVSTQAISSAGEYTVSRNLSSGEHTIGATVIDQAMYDDSDTDNVTVATKIKKPPIVLGSVSRYLVVVSSVDGARLL